MKTPDLEEQAYQAVLARFRQKTDIIAAESFKVFKPIYDGPNGQEWAERPVMVPIMDGRRVYNIGGVSLKQTCESEGRAIVTAFEKAIMLHVIDEAWKENLRELDELKHSVQNASYEQKDPLLIFKLESVKLFDNMVNTMNNRSVSILMRAQIPEMQQVQEAAPEQHTQRQQYTESKQNLSQEQMTDPNQAAAAAQDTRARQPQAPIIKDKLPGRNDPCPCGSGKKFKNCHGRGLV
jgi:preprotein translocase subunit SecA